MEARTADDRGTSSRRERVLLDLARRDKSDVRDTFRAITEASAVVLDVERVGIWRLLPDGSAIVCEDNFVRTGRRHTRGETLLASECPAYFDALSENRVIAAHDARRDPRTRELAMGYLEPHGIFSMMDVPIWHHGRAFGVLCHERVGPPRRWSTDHEAFAGNLADLASLSLEAGEHRAAEHRWATVVNAITEAVFVVDRHGRLALANGTAAHMAKLAGGGLSFEERHRLVEFRDAKGRVLPPDETPASRSLRGEVLQGELVQMVFRRNGERRWYRVSCAPLYDSRQIRSVVAVVSDVTEETYFESLKRDVLAALAHELKTPVAIVKGHTQHAARNGGVPTQPMMGAIERATSRLERLIEDLVEVSGLNLGRLVLARELLDLEALVRSVVRHAAAAAPERLIRLHTSGPAPVLADRPRVEQAVRRLVENALRYSPGREPVDVTLAQEGATVLLSVRDRGIGIPAAQQGRMFEIFFRAHAGTPHDLGGLGIGLYLAREITLRHGGQLWLESAEGRGSTFFMRLPRVEVP
jgi:signal transduction histidine kinase